MADLVTHMASVLLPALALPRRYAVPLAFGVVLPDLGSRVPGLAMEVLIRGGVPVPSSWMVPWGVLHSPLGLLLLIALVLTLVVPEDRRAIATCLGLGAMAHLGLDVLQDHHGVGYPLGWPVTCSDFELGWIGSEATTAWAPWLGVLTLAAWSVRGWRHRSTTVADSPAQKP